MRHTCGQKHMPRPFLDKLSDSLEYWSPGEEDMMAQHCQQLREGYLISKNRYEIHAKIRMTRKLDW